MPPNLTVSAISCISIEAWCPKTIVKILLDKNNFYKNGTTTLSFKTIYKYIVEPDTKCQPALFSRKGICPIDTKKLHSSKLMENILL